MLYHLILLLFYLRFSVYILIYKYFCFLLIKEKTKEVTRTTWTHEDQEKWRFYFFHFIFHVQGKFCFLKSPQIYQKRLFGLSIFRYAFAVYMLFWFIMSMFWDQ